MKSAQKKSPRKKTAEKKAARAPRVPRRKVCMECNLVGRHAPACSQGLRPSPDAELPIEIVEGARYWSVDDAELRVTKIAGDVVHYVIDDGETVFTERRGRFREIVARRIGDELFEPADGPREVKATVDGNDAAIVIDGTTGRAASDVAAADADAINDVLRRLARANETLLEKERAKKKAGEDHKAAQTEQNTIVLELVRLGHAEPMLPGMSRAISETRLKMTKAPEDDEFEDFEGDGA